MAQKKQRRKKKKQTQESSAAHGTLTDVRRNMQQAAGKDDKTLKILIWGSVAFVGLALLYAVLAP